MSLPQSVKDRLKEAHNITVTGESSLSGGSINSAHHIKTNRGDLFLKWNPDAPIDFFEKEAEGLKLLRSAETRLRIPDVIALETSGDGLPGFLVMEFIQSGISGDSTEFGSEFARLHQTKADEFGLISDNYIGSLPQSNQRQSDWESFFSDERINPQLKMAVDSGKMDQTALKAWTRISSKLDELLPGTDPSLVHGDFWSGNYMFDSKGCAVLIDPAVYYGHPEMDLAFSKMFGGFSTEFYKGYESVMPLEHGFDERVPIYNLYPLLVHVNLFGGHYISQANGVLKQFS
jgi:fructosamine-3-kinase